MIELIGYVGSVCVAVSLMLTNVRKLRLLNMAGAILFASYGLVIHAMPVVILNAFNAVVNIVVLLQMARSKDSFMILPLPEVKTSYLQKFLDYHRNDIKKYFPLFNWEELGQPQAFFILRNLVPAGLFVYELLPDGTADIKLDYVTPDYRDFKNARFLYFDQHILLRTVGQRTLLARSDVPAHITYLKKVGFRRDSNEPTLFSKTL